jgi:hypothetical protein
MNMQNNTDVGFNRVQSLLRFGAEMAYDMDNHDLGHGIIDLCRAARTEIGTIGLKGGGTDVPVQSFEGMLLYRLMPEIARRLVSEAGADLLLLRGERPGADVTNIPQDRLRRYVSMCLAKSTFPIISEKVRDRLDPDFMRPDSFFANEAIQHDVRSGNIVEIALNRVAPSLSSGPNTDHISSAINQWAMDCGMGDNVLTWSPEIPEYTGDSMNISNTDVGDFLEAEALDPALT